MRGVTCGADRHPVDHASLRYWDTAGVWVFECVGGEFVIRGGPDGPDPIRLDLARRVAASISMFVAEANVYLAAFVAPERFKAFGPWNFEAAEFGQQSVERFRAYRTSKCYPADDRVDVFEIILSLGNDIYGVWGVRFACSDFGGLESTRDRFHAHAFRRLQN
jgi:hypothetical protein